MSTPVNHAQGRWNRTDMRLLNKAARAQHVWEDVVVLHINHCMDNSFYFNDVLKTLFFKVVFLSPPYNNQEVEETYPGPCYHALRRQDGRYHLRKDRQDLGLSSGEFFEATLLLLEEAFRRDLLPLLQAGKQLLIIEDGGYHFDALSRIRHIYPDIEKQIVGVVEQTTSGTRSSTGKEGYRYAYPCASIARSHIKMSLESIFIGQRVVEELSLMLYEADAFFPFHSVLLLGYGIVGRSCRMALAGRFCQLAAYDADPQVLEVAREDGLTVYDGPDPAMFGRDTIVIGCVGMPSFGKDMFAAFLQGRGKILYLASGSSKDVEFAYFLRYAAGKEEPIPGLVLEGREEGRWYTRYRFRYQGQEKQVVLFAEGKPVNFYREDVVSLTYRVIDLVFTEMLLSALTLCQNRDLPPKLYVLGEDNPVTQAVSEEKLLQLWFRENGFYCAGELDSFLQPHPLSDKLRKIVWGEDRG